MIVFQSLKKISLQINKWKYKEYIDNWSEIIDLGDCLNCRLTKREQDFASEKVLSNKY